MAGQGNNRWVGTWTVSPTAMDGVSLDGQTVRMIAHISRGGEALRVRLSNAYGTATLNIGGARIALRGGGDDIDPATDTAISFGGSETVAIAPGALAISDPIAFEAPPLADLVVSLFVPGTLPQAAGITGHVNVCQTCWVSPAGDFTREQSMPVASSIDGVFFLSAIEVHAAADTKGIVAIGDSLTISNISTVGANNRWPDQLARRFAMRDGDAMPGIMNQGIGGNRIVHNSRGGSLQARWDRDVLAQPGITHAIVFLGINDIRNRNRKPEEDVTARELIDGLAQLAHRTRSRGIAIYGGAMLTFENENYNPPPDLPGFYTPEREIIRQEVNEWIRNGGAFDAVIDFDLAIRDPGHPTRMLPAYDCGDHLHPGDAGYLAMGDYVDLKLFD
jgi:lysophospholipase L1-like esterase